MFDQDLPESIKESRESRKPDEENPPPADLVSDQKSSAEIGKEMYLMISVNCKYKSKIQSLLRDISLLSRKRTNLQEMYITLKQDLNKKPPVIYKPVKGDKIDEMFAVHLNKAQINLPVKREGPGKYLFGSKKLLVQIKNGKLLIKVGGGYMGADEFIE